MSFNTKLLYRIRSAFEVIFRKSATLQDVTPDIESGPMMGTPGVGQDATPSPGISKKVQLVRRTY